MRMAVDLERRVERAAQALGDGDGIGRVGDVVDQHVELIAAMARQRQAGLGAGGHVGGAQARLQAPRHGHEQAIGRRGAEAVVDDAEAVEREHEDGEAVVGLALDAGDGALDHVEEQEAVGEAGQRVGQLGFGDVGERTGEARRHARRGFCTAAPRQRTQR